MRYRTGLADGQVYIMVTLLGCDDSIAAPVGVESRSSVSECSRCAEGVFSRRAVGCGAANALGQA
jgi:hypothetical protein